MTETDELARALDDAAKRWPEDAAHRSRLLLRLVAEGHRVVAAEAEDARAAWLEVVSRTAGVGTGWYGPGYLEELREDWPE